MTDDISKSEHDALAAKAHHVAAFSCEEAGGNPAGVLILDALPSAAMMQAIAKSFGHSETVFAARLASGAWRVRYFAPQAEVPFCGHATIALGAMLASQGHEDAVRLILNQGEACVTGCATGKHLSATFESPPTGHSPATLDILAQVLGLFGYTKSDLSKTIAPALISAGARHFFLPLRRSALVAAMAYDFDAGRQLMKALGLVTVCIGVSLEGGKIWHVRNAFAAGGVYEDPATGAAAAALAGYLAACNIGNGDAITIQQGAEMAIPCRLRAIVPSKAGSCAKISGSVRYIRPPKQTVWSS